MISQINTFSIQHRGNAFSYGFNKKTIGKSLFVPIEPIESIIPQDKLNINFNDVTNYSVKQQHSENPNQDIQDKNLIKENIFSSYELHKNKAPKKQNSANNDKTGKTSKTDKKMSEKDKRMIEQLKKRDKEVRTHEQSHMIAGGNLIRGAASYTYQLGPDGKRYAIGGEVHIDISPENDPKKTIAKMQKVVATALAPADPSSQDYSVARQARKNEENARKELKEIEDEEQRLQEQKQLKKKNNIEQKKSLQARLLEHYKENNIKQQISFVV